MGRTHQSRALSNLPSEAELADAWEERRYASRELVDSRGRRLRVVFPGRRWGGPGPDFRGAVLALADGTLLHVVGREDAPTLDCLGQPIATLVLRPRPAWPAAWPGPGRATRRRSRRPGCDRRQEPWERELGPCVRTSSDVLRVVEEAGWARFRARTARFEGDLAVAEADQVLWRGLAEALGYSRNTAAFGRLAEAVPWS